MTHIEKSTRIPRRALALGMAVIAAVLFSTAPAAQDQRAARLVQQAKTTANVDERIRLLRESIDLAPSFIAWYYLGRDLLSQGRNAQAQEAFRSAYGLAPDAKTTATAMARAGEAALDAGELVDGLALVEEARERYPGAPPQWMLDLSLRGDIERSNTLIDSKTIVQALSGGGEGARSFGLVERRIDLSVNFDTNKFDIASIPEGPGQVDAIAEAIRDMGPIDQHYVFVGHTDVRGSEPYNQVLSERRAESVRAYVAEHVPEVSGSLCALGRGESDPKQPLSNTNNENAPENQDIHKVNRRVEIKVTDVCN